MAGAKLILSTDSTYAEKGCLERIFVDYKNITEVMNVGQQVFIDDGLISLRVLEKVGFVTCVAFCLDVKHQSTL